MKTGIGGIGGAIGGMMGPPTDPNAEPIDDRFPASQNAVIEQLSPAERDEYAELWNDHQAALEEAGFPGGSIEDRDNARYRNYLAQHGPQMTKEEFLAADNRRIENLQLENYRETTGNPDATADDMYAAGHELRQEALDAQLENFRETSGNPDASLVDMRAAQFERFGDTRGRMQEVLENMKEQMQNHPGLGNQNQGTFEPGLDPESDPNHPAGPNGPGGHSLGVPPRAEPVTNSAPPSPLDNGTGVPSNIF